MKAKFETAVLGSGCFWCTEAVYKQIKGVRSAVPGYAGGSTVDPTYESVSSGNTGHAEVVKVEFDPKVINYERILDIFWNSHDPTTPNRQGNDVGSQYRSIILYTNNEQKQIAEKSKTAVQAEFSQPIVTEIKPLEKFYVAEDYHHDYFAKNPDKAYCQVVIAPKVAKVRQKYANNLSNPTS